jgi:hypothetical protein
VSLRTRHSKDRRQYEKENPICELCNCRPTVTTHHIIQGGLYEDIRIYIATCDKCHGDDRHTNRGRDACIRVKVRKGEWFASEEEEREFFGGRTYRDWEES